MKILLVCTGNLCRSPMAAAVLAARLRDRGMVGIRVESAGTAGFEGEPAERLARGVAAEAGYDLSAHRSRAVTKDLLESSDLVLVMSRQHGDYVHYLAPGHRDVHLLGSFLEEAERGRTGGEIFDPIGGSPEEYGECLALIEAAVDGLLDRLGSLTSDATGGLESTAERVYFGTIESRVSQARGSVAGLSSMEFHIVDRWWRQHVPLWLALEALEATASRWPDGEAPRGALRHADQELSRRLEEAGQPAREAASPEAPEAIPVTVARRAAEEAIRAALSRVDPAHADLRAALESAERSVASAPDEPAALGDLFEELERRIFEAAAACLPANRLRSIEEEERPRLRALAAGMSAAAFDETLRRLLRDRVFEELSLPRLSLSALAAAPPRPPDRR